MTKYDLSKYVVVCQSVFLFIISLVIFACNTEAESTHKSAQSSPSIDRASYSMLSGHYLAARFAFGQNDISSAAHYYRRTLTEDPKNAILVQRALALGLQEGQVSESFPLANRLVGLSPKSKIGHLSLLIDAFSHKNHKKALYHLDHLGREGVFEFVTPLLHGWLLLANGDFEAAQIAVKPLQDNRAFQIYHAYHIALMAAVLGNDTEAEKYFKIAFNAIPGGTLRVTLGYSLYLKNAGRLEEALRVVEKHKRHNPDSGWIVAIGDIIKAVHSSKHIVNSISEGLAEVLLGAASALPNQSAGGMSLTYAQLALHLRPESPVIQFLIGESFDSIGRYEEAITAYGAVAPNSPYYWSSRLRAAASLANVDREKEAVQNLEKMVNQKVDRADAAIALADLLRSNTRYKEALKYYDIAISRIANFEAKHWALFYSRGTVFERIKEWPKAEADFFYALKLEPDQPLVLNYLGYSWVEQGTNLENAMRFIEKAVALRPMDGYIVDSLGWAFYRLGKLDAAVKHLERASELQAGDPVIADHLGDIYWALGRRNEAKFQWERALVLGADEQIIDLINKKLLEGIPGV